MAWMHVQLSSAQVGMPVHVEVLLPQAAVEVRKEEERLPVLYLLHDRSGDHTQWLRKAALETWQEEAPVAIVMPSGNESFFMDMRYGKKYESYIREELPGLCERLFPLSSRREEKYLAGAGMGGYGALNIGLSENCPFGVIGAFQADIDMKYYYEKEPERMEDIFGGWEEYENSSHCLLKQADRRKGKGLPEIVMMCAGEGRIPEENRRLYSILSQYGGQTELRESRETPGWSYYNQCLYSFILEADKTPTSIGGE